MEHEQGRAAAATADFLANLIASLEDAIVVTDASDRIVIFNQAAEHLTGVPHSYALHRNCADVFAPNAAVAEMVTRACSLSASQSCGDEQLVFGSRSFPARLSCSPVRGPAGQVQGAALVIQDISYQKKLEDEARRSESLARLGAVIAGLAHEVKNPLGGIRGAAQLLAKRFADDAELQSYTDVVIREADRLSALVEQLLATGAPRPPRIGSVNVHQVLREVLDLMSPELKKQGVSVRLQIDPSLPDVQGDPAQLTQLLLNLVKNALEAIQGKGNVTITTRMETDFHIVRHPEDVETTAQTRPSKLMRLEVADSGPGFPAHELDRVFEPFFSTKSRGTGLGLSICERIVAAHGGDIRAGNAPAGGGVLTVNLRLVDA